MTTLALILIAMTIASYQLGRWRSLALVGGPANAPRLHSRPRYYGYLVAMWCSLPALALVAVWAALDETVIVRLLLTDLPDEFGNRSPGELDLLVNTIRNLASGAVVDRADGALDALVARYRGYQSLSGTLLAFGVAAVAGLSVAFSLRRLSPSVRARNEVEGVLTRLLVMASSVALITTIGIVLSVLFEALRFFGEVPLAEFLFGTEWSPQTSIRADQVGSSGNFGAVPLFAGTLLITLVAMAVALPLGLMTAIYLSEYAGGRLRAVAKPLLEILAGIPTVVYGFFAAVTIAPAVGAAGRSVGLDIAAESALAAGAVMGFMILPLVSSMSEDALSSVPRSLRDASLALGATRSETIIRVLIPAALPGISGGVLLAVSRAIGETMIVVMAAGLAANLSANPLEAVTTVTVQIVTLLVGDQEFASARTLAAFALGLVLFIVTLTLNVVGLHIVRHYRERYS